MFRSNFDHPQEDIFFSFTSVTKDKIIWFVVACLLYLLCFVLMLLRALRSLVVCCIATTRLAQISLFAKPKRNVCTLLPLYTQHCRNNNRTSDVLVTQK
jgi:hypothetical protein